MHFLSRLYGGELFLLVLVAASAFLSRLYGGEQDPVGYQNAACFLSRLYGGEPDYVNGLAARLVSKPPIRRGTLLCHEIV